MICNNKGKYADCSPTVTTKKNIAIISYFLLFICLTLSIAAKMKQLFDLADVYMKEKM